MSLRALQPTSLRRTRRLVEKGLARVDELFAQQVREFDPGVAPYVASLAETSGKRIRPSLAILVGGALGEVEEQHLQLGLIVELIHVATLVHDDIIDGAETRRNEPTATAKWGAGLAVLLGDSLFSHALKLSTDFDRLDVSRAISLAAREVCQGEILQTQRRFDLTLSEEDYYRIIEMKTGALFAAASGLSALLSGASSEVVEALHDFGMKLGTAYQVYDDCVDLIGEEREAGKTLGTDLNKGKLTLPILKLLQAVEPVQHEVLSRQLASEEPVSLLGLPEYEVAISASLREAHEKTAEAREALCLLPENEHRQSLEELCDYLDELLAGAKRG